MFNFFSESLLKPQIPNNAWTWLNSFISLSEFVRRAINIKIWTSSIQISFKLLQDFQSID